MRIKSFAIMFLCVLTLCSGLMLAGCGDKYASVSIKVDKTEVSLKIDGDSAKEGELSNEALLNATLSGATAEMTRGMSFRFDDKSIVTVSVENSGDTNKIKLTASTAGTTNMYIVSNENGNIVSEPITVTVYRDAETMTFNKDKKPSVKLGESLKLLSEELLRFAVNGENVKVFPNEATFSLMTPDDNRWNSSYGEEIPTGVSVQDNTLYASADAKCGIVQLVATLGELSTPVYVMVYKDINADENIILYKNGEEVTDTIGAVINLSDDTSPKNTMVFVPSIKDNSQKYDLTVTSRASEVLLVSSQNVNKEFYASVLNSGITKVDVTANVVDTVTGETYVTFTKTYDVRISRVVTSIFVSSDDVEKTEEPAEMTVQDLYVNNKLGKRVHINVSPNNDDEGGVPIDTDVVLSIAKIDDNENVVTSEVADDVVVYVNKQLYNWGDFISDDSDIYVSLGAKTSVKKSFRLQISANMHDKNLPVGAKISTYIDFNVEVGVKEVHSSLNSKKLGVGQTAEFTLSYLDSQGNENTGTPDFTFSKSEYFTITQKSGYKYTITAIKEGQGVIIVSAESGASCEIEINIYTVLDSMGITVEDTDHILSKTLATASAIINGVANTGVTEFTVERGSTIKLGYEVNPTSVGANSFGIRGVSVSDPSYIEVGNEFNKYGKLNLYASQVTEDKAVELTIQFYHYIKKDDGVERAVSSRTISITVYETLDAVCWNGTANSQKITAYVYNANNLSFEDKEAGKGSITLSIKYNENASFFRDKDFEWSTKLEADKEVVTITKLEAKKGEVLVTTHWNTTNDESLRIVTIYASATEFGRTYYLTCDLTIINPIKVSSIELLSDYDSINGLRLNEVGASHRTQTQIVLKVNPKDAYNQKLNYVILKQNLDGSMEEVSEDDTIIELDKNNPNIIKAKTGKSGECWVRIYPQDARTTKDITYKDVTIYKDIKVVVEDGEKFPYSIYESAEFMAIGDSAEAMTKNYLLMNSIDVSGFNASLFPLCGDTAFTGSITTKNDQKFSISGLPIVNNAVVVGDNAYLGVFSQILSSAEKTALSNIDFYFNDGSIDLSQVNVSQVYAGLLAGKITGKLTNVFVGYTSYRTNQIYVDNLSQNQTLYFGAVAGEFTDRQAESVYANVSLRINNKNNATLIVGGLFGRFAGVSLGQNDSLVSNVKIYVENQNVDTTKLENATTCNEGVGGLIGVADTYTTSEGSSATGTIRSMQVMGSISAPGVVNVGGLVGINKINLGSDNGNVNNKILYKNLASVRVNGLANVGGFVGANFGKINYGVSEMYDSISVTNPCDLIWVQGLYNVGGFAGFGSETALISYSYAMSYVNRTMIAYNSTPTTEEPYFYGDIIGVANTGGFVGSSGSQISKSFAYAQIQQITSTDPSVSALPNYSGGFAGKIDFSQSSSSITNTFAIGNMLTTNVDSTPYGEFVGYYNALSDNLIGFSYAVVYITAGDTNVYNFAGVNESGKSVLSSFYMDDRKSGDYASTDSTTSHGYNYNAMTINKQSGETNIYLGDCWGFTPLNSTGTKQQWVAWDESIKGVNKNLPILYDANGKMLYSQVISEINATPNSEEVETGELPTYFAYSDPETNKTLGSVVLLDKIIIDQTNQYSIALNDLFKISVAPENLNNSPDEWKISIESSNYNIVEVVQPNQSLLNAKLVFKSCGVATITLRSLLDINIYCQIEINVVGGFSEFNVHDGNGNDLVDKLMYIKVDHNGGYRINSYFVEAEDNREFITTKGFAYTTRDYEYISFASAPFEIDTAYISSQFPAIISGLKTKDEAISIGVYPYIELQFGNKTYRKTFPSLSKTINAKVYNGISSVDVYSGVHANVESGTEVVINVDVVSDVEEIVEIADINLTKDNEKVALEPYLTLVSRDIVKVITNNAFECYENGVLIKDKLKIAEIIQKIITGEDVQAYIVINGQKYTTQEEVNSKSAYLLTDCVRYTYKLSLKGDERAIAKNVVFNLNYTVRDKSEGEIFEQKLEDDITFIPAKISSLKLLHYTYGANSMEAGEVAGYSISPGTRGILVIDISPAYAHFDYVGINSSPNTLMMQQLVYVNGVYRYITTNAEYDSLGSLKLRKVSGIDKSGEYFNGKIYVSTLIASGTPEGEQFTIYVAPMLEGSVSPLMEPQSITLTTTFAPFATLSLVGSDTIYTNNIVGKGTVANLRLKGTMLNSRVTFSTTYDGLTNDKLTQCAFTEKTQYSYDSGEKEEVDIVVPFYVGLLAKPDNGKIVIYATIQSWTKLGGQLDPLIVSITLNLVDYVVKSAYTIGTETRNLQVSVNSYTALVANFNVQTPVLSDFENYIGYSSNDSSATKEKEAFATQLEALNKLITEKLEDINSLGEGNGGVWWFDSGSGYSRININSNYLDFLVVFDDNESENCYKIRGRDLQTDFPLKLLFEAVYIYDEDLGCYRFSLSDDVNDDNLGYVLDGYLQKYDQDFYVDLTDQSDEDKPYAIDSAEAFATTMVEGGDYMLTADIVLNNWKPIDTAINSLDGNGHIIYLNSFASNSDTTSVNYGLFSTLAEGSVLKNLIVDVSHNVYVNLQGVATVKFGFIAGVNNGIIYNCDVVVTSDADSWFEIYENTAIVESDNADDSFGREIFNSKVKNPTTEADERFKSKASTFVMTSKTVDSATVSSTIGGLVGENSETGSITNSRVGRIETDNFLGTTNIHSQQGLNIFANGNVGGLVGENSGVISNSYFANGYIVNSLMSIYSSNNTSGARTGGLVAVQNSGGRIFGSYARGQLDKDITRSSLGGIFARSTVGGLVHSNSGVISNSYSNLNLSSASGMGGFVYENLNGATISHSYSLSTVKTEGLINGVFIGVDSEGNLLDNANSTVENCFYLTEEGVKVDSSERAMPLVQESWGDSTGSSFEGFTISTEKDGENTWYIDSERSYLGPQLYLADQVFVASRTVLGENKDYLRGTKINPLIITSLSSWNDRIFNFKDETHKSSYIDVVDTDATKGVKYQYKDAYIMLLCDIDFDNSLSTVTSRMSFEGHFYGNGHKIQGLNYTQPRTDTSAPNNFGLFAEINGATVSNVDLIINDTFVSQASHVGVLAGNICSREESKSNFDGTTDITIYPSLIENVTIASSSLKGVVQGKNIVGALAGYVSGSSYIYNIKSNLSVSASSATKPTQTFTYYNGKNAYSANLSYAGGIIGVLDLEKLDNNLSSPRVRNLTIQNTLSIANTRYYTTIEMEGEIVGGVIGQIGTNSEVYKAYFDIVNTEKSSLLRGSNFTGGLVGENRGALLNSRLALSTAEQIESDSSILYTDTAPSFVGYRGLFASEYASNAVGGLVGLNVGGTIRYSYNRVAVDNIKTRVAGGLIGLAINAPSVATSSTDPVNKYLQNINLDKANLLKAVDGGIKYIISGTTITPESEDKISPSAYLTEVYTTAFVNGESVIGELVGAQINAPIYVEANSYIVGANAYSNDSDFVARINGSDSTLSKVEYIGSATGFLGLNYTNEPSDYKTIAYVSDCTSGGVSQGLFVTNEIAGKEIYPVGNMPKSMIGDVENTGFIKSAIDSENKPFEHFSTDEWNLDNDKLEYRFPYHKIGYDSPVTDIKNLDEFFEKMLGTKTNASSHYRLISDLTITGDRWEAFCTSLVNEDGLVGKDIQYSLGAIENYPVKGTLEGAVTVIEAGKYTTRSASITFKDFSEEQKGMYHSLFGYTSNFKMNNINFVYTFDFDAKNVSKNVKGSKLSDFALLMTNANATKLNNIFITMAGEDSNGDYTKYSLIYDSSHESAGNISNLAVAVAKTTGNCVFNNVRFDAKMEVEGVSSDFTMGALVGFASGSLIISGVDQGDVNIKYTSGNDTSTYIGGLVGLASGVVNLSGSLNDTGNIRGQVTVSLKGSKTSYLGGAIGKTENTINLKNFTSNVCVTLNRANDANLEAIDYVGGITSMIANSNISNVRVLGDIFVNSGNGTIFVGGIAGQFDNNHTFSKSHTGYTTQNSGSYGAINITGAGYTNIYAGGIYGFTQEHINMLNGKEEPSGSESENVYYALYSSADININVEANIIHAGGIIGFAKQGVTKIIEESQTSTTQELTKPNAVLRVASCGYVGDLLVKNTKTDTGHIYVGGLIGESQLLIQDAYSNGALSVQASSQQMPINLGGITGLAKGHIVGAVSLSVINYSREFNENDDGSKTTFVDPIAILNPSDSKNSRDQVYVLNVYCSPELNGVYCQHDKATVLTTAEVFSTQTCESIANQLINWNYNTISYNEDDSVTSFAILLPTDIISLADLSEYGQIVPTLVTQYKEISEIVNSESGLYKHKTIILANDVTVDNSNDLKELNNIRRIVGNGNSIMFDTSTSIVNTNTEETGYISAVGGLFNEIPNNVLISSVGIKFNLLQVHQKDGVSYIGALAGANYGTIFNVSVGALPSIDEGYMGSNPTKNVATFSSNVSAKYQSSIIDSREIATVLVTFYNTTGSVGGMFGFSSGLITNSFVSVDISISGDVSGNVSVGSLAGETNSTIIDNVITNGRINLTSNSNVGGVVGSVTNTVAKGIVSNVNMGIFSKNTNTNKAGFAFGTFDDKTSLYNGVIVNTDISATDSSFFSSNKAYTLGLKTLEMNSEIAQNAIAPEEQEDEEIDTGFRKDLWTRAFNNYYGYPMLNTITNVDFNTGDGSKNNPYQFAETSQLLGIENVIANGVYCCLTRDMVVSPQNYAKLSKIAFSASELNGMGHTIVIYELPFEELLEQDTNTISLGLFSEVQKDKTICNVGIAFVNNITYTGAYKINFGGLAVRNYGTISNCYVVSNDISSPYYFNRNDTSLTSVINTFATGTISFTNSPVGSYIGGLVSQNYNLITNSWCDVNFEGKEGNLGGIIGLQDKFTETDEEGKVIRSSYGRIKNSFSSGAVHLIGNNTNGTNTSAGGLVGKNMSYVGNDWAIRDCYVYGAKLNADKSGLNIGALVGYNGATDDSGKNVLSTYRTYCYVATYTTKSGETPTGNYISLGMVGNRDSITNNDTTSSFAVKYYTDNGFNYNVDNEIRTDVVKNEFGNLTTIGSDTTNNGLRGYRLDSSIYSGWYRENGQLWTRRTFGSSLVGSMLYILNVTPLDRQEDPASLPKDYNLFRVTTSDSSN